jgi:hypothetical protein
MSAPSRLTSAYYFRAHLYTYVPDQVARDMDWMAEHGTDAVVLGLLEQDFFAAVENVAGICAAAEERGLRILITPSRWGNLVAGCPKVPSIFSATRLDALACDREGRPHIGWLGGYASVHHPDTREFFITHLQRAFDLWPISGVIWDEPKGLKVIDYSEAARKVFQENGWVITDPACHTREAIRFFDQVSLPVKAAHPEAHFGLFTFGHVSDLLARQFAALECLDAFGCDGRPWPRGLGSSDSIGESGAKKSLIDDGPRFIRAAREAGKLPLFLIENHALTRGDLDLMAEYLPRVLEQDIGHLLYYYYPRSCEDPDRAMQVLGKFLV